MAKFYVKPGGTTAPASATDPSTPAKLDTFFGASNPMGPGDTCFACIGNSGESFDIYPTGTGGGEIEQVLARVGTNGTRDGMLNLVGANASGVPTRGVRPTFKAMGTYGSTQSMWSIGTDVAASAPIQYMRDANIIYDANDKSYNSWNNGGILTSAAVAAQRASGYFIHDNILYDRSAHNGLSPYGGASGSTYWLSHVFNDCEITRCGHASLGRPMISREGLALSFMMNRCSVHDNNGSVRIAGAGSLPVIILNSAFSRNEVAALDLANKCLLLQKLVVYANVAMGMQLQPDPLLSRVANCVVAKNGTLGVYDLVWDGTAASSPYEGCDFFDNLATDFNADLLDLGGGGNEGYITPPGVGHVDIDPAFVRVTPGSEDLRARARQLREVATSRVAGMGDYVACGVEQTTGLLLGARRGLARDRT